MNDTRTAQPGAALPFAVVIATRNRPAELERCLQGVGRLRPAPAEVLVADNSPDDGSAKPLAECFGARYLAVTRRGMCCARNVAAHACTSELIAFIDDDAVPEPGWLAGLYPPFADRRIMAVAGRILPLRVHTEAERLSECMGGFETGGAEARIVDKSVPLWFEIANFGGIGTGANVAFRRSAYEFWPGFDERIGRGKLLSASEESAAFFHLIDAGFRVAYAPLAVVRHPFAADMKALRARCLDRVRMHVAYITMLWFEHPAYRRELLRYLLTAWEGRRRWRPPLPDKCPRVVSRWRVLVACMFAPMVYAKCRIREGRRACRREPEQECEVSSRGSGRS